MKKYLPIVFSLIYFSSCKKPCSDRPMFYAGYPKEVGKIIINKCATTGCHDATSFEGAGNLDLSSYAHLFASKNSNSPVVPFSPERSPLLHFVNTYDELGPKLSPSMPIGGNPLSKEEVLTINSWIAGGARDEQGKLNYLPSKNSKVMLVMSSICKKIALLDINDGKIKRYLNIEDAPGFPSDIVFSETGNHWYLLFSSGRLIQYSGEDFTRISSIELGQGNWKELHVRKGSNELWVLNHFGYSDYTGGEIAVISENTFTLKSRTDNYYFPTGLTFDSYGFAYTSCYTGNFIYKINANNLVENTKIMVGSSTQVAYDGNEIRSSNLLIPEGKNYLLYNSEKNNYVGVWNLETSKKDREIPTGAVPQKMIFENGKLWVSCMEEPNMSGKKGMVFLFTENGWKRVKYFYTGYQSRAMAINPNTKEIFVCNRNADPTGADAPHHYSDCGGANGYVTKLDAFYLKNILGYKCEVMADPYACSIRP